MNYPVKKIAAASALSIIALIALIAVGRQATSDQSPAAPGATLPLKSYDFGDVYKGEVISHTFIIRNEGKADLLIKDVTAACGCSVADSDRVIPAGKDGMAVLEVDTNTQAGAITKVATLRTNDPAQPNIVLSLVANVLTSSDGGPVKGVTLRPGKHIGPLFVGPGDRWTARSMPGQSVSTVFDISAERGPVKLLRVEGNSPRFISRLETVEEGSRYRLVVELKSATPPGSYEDRLVIATDNAALPSFRISLNLNVAASQ